MQHKPFKAPMTTNKSTAKSHQLQSVFCMRVWTYRERFMAMNLHLGTQRYFDTPSPCIHPDSNHRWLPSSGTPFIQWNL